MTRPSKPPVSPGPHMPHVAICIATYRRPDGLRRLLESLATLTFQAGPAPRISVVVVDNDAAATALHPPAGFPFGIAHHIEPTRGLAAVRNACLDHAPADADAVAFVDDDEWVEPGWLDALLAMQRATGAEVIQGPVKPAYLLPPPPWLAGSHFHEVGPFADGASIGHGATGNVLISRQALATSGARFHASYNRSGGEDVDFFQQMLAAGCRIVAATGAIAHETIPAERMTLRWVLQRQFRTGHSLGCIARRQGSVGSVAVRLTKAGGRFVMGAGQALVGGLVSTRRAVEGLGNMAWGLGTFAAYTPLDLDHYSRR